MEDAMTSVPGGRQARGGALLALASVVLAAACGGGGGAGDEGADAAGGGRGGPRLEQPAADDPEALEPVLADLLERHDDVVNEVLADPAVARDEDDPLIQEYLSLYSPDSAVPRQVVDSWVADAEAGRVTHPVEAGHPAVAARIVGELRTVSDYEVRFPICSELRYASYDGDGALVEMVPYREQPGEATAVRVDGQWLLQQVDAFDGQASCPAREGTTEEPS
jgi:hypothetical protein